jgi:hypothetical protein
MQLILHTGAHFTEQERLIKSLLRNKGAFEQRRIAVPEPDNYRGLMRETLNAMHRTPASPEVRELLLDVLLDGATADRVILSDPNFFRTPAWALRKGQLYPAAARRMRFMAEVFPDDDIRIFLAIRNPAALLPMLRKAAGDQDDDAFWGDRDPLDVRWSDTVQGIREAAPQVPITVWCNEDMPLIWSQIIREMAGFSDHEAISGGFDLLASIMSEEGMQRFRAYLDAHPDLSELQRQRVIAAFLDKFALADEIEEELDMDGWTGDLVDEMTDHYDADVLAIQRIPGVSLITP